MADRVQIVPDPPAEPKIEVPDANVEIISNDDGKEIVRAQVVPKDKPQRDPSVPEWVPEKFQKTEDLRQATVELAKKLGRGGREVAMLEKLPIDEDYAGLYADLEAAQSKGGKADEEKVEEPPAAKTPEQTRQEVTDLLEKNGLKFDDFQGEFSKDGKLSDESYTKLEKAGLSKSLVDSWIAGQQAIADRQVSELYSLMGGSADSFQAMGQWAVQNLPAEEITAFNDAMAAGGSKAVVAAKGMYALYKNAGQVPPKLVQGSTSATSSAQPKFESTAEMVRAMSDPRYQTDEAYRRSVIARIP